MNKYSAIRLNMRYFKAGFIILLILLQVGVISCNKSIKDIPVLDINSIDGKIELNFTDIAKNIKPVILEYNEEFPIGSSTDYILGEKYIIVLCRDYILQYTINGEFIRLLAEKGSGPDQLGSISSYYTSLDSTEIHMFTYDWQHPEEVACFDLESGLRTDPVPVFHGDRIGSINCTGENTLLVVPSNYINSEYLYYFQDMQGNLIEGYRLRKGAMERLSFSLIKPEIYKEHYLYYNTAYCGDTLYLINRNNMMPCLVLKTGDHNIPLERKGHDIHIRIIMDQFLLFQDLLIDIDNSILDHHTYIMNPEIGKGYEIVSFSNDLIGAEYYEDQLIRYSWDNIISNNKINKLAIKVDAVHFKNSIKANKERIHDDYKSPILSVDSLLSENDNPVLLIGEPVSYNILE